METIKFLDMCKNEVAVGKRLPSQYVEQCFIAQVEGEITREEFRTRSQNVPFSPLLAGAMPRCHD